MSDLKCELLEGGDDVTCDYRFNAYRVFHRWQSHLSLTRRWSIRHVQGAGHLEYQRRMTGDQRKIGDELSRRALRRRRRVRP